MSYSKLSGNATLDKRVYDAQFVVGATGAVGAITGQNILSIVRDGTGQYTVEVDDLGKTLVRALYCHAAVRGATQEVLVPFIDADTMSSDGKVQITFLNAAGSAADPTAANIVHFLIGVECAAE